MYNIQRSNYKMYTKAAIKYNNMDTMVMNVDTLSAKIKKFL